VSLNYGQSLEAGGRIDIVGQPGIVRTVETLLREHEVRLVLQLLPDRS